MLDPSVGSRSRSGAVVHTTAFHLHRRPSRSSPPIIFIHFLKKYIFSIKSLFINVPSPNSRITPGGWGTFLLPRLYRIAQTCTLPLNEAQIPEPPLSLILTTHTQDAKTHPRPLKASLLWHPRCFWRFRSSFGVIQTPWVPGLDAKYFLRRAARGEIP